ncbi:histone-lysine N-methyltransferase SUV39H2-like [Centruroides sculpturatus]|uniref:histone-lysine N-methyltransferase SUV39H2-like n=1 Tax=Centruroides sculpturatus TaxID=218467 RepID=UPI000C6ECF84|nr:histone-lysine N-methyltransferase SUV39H2-like [Centruroides sculpturatus]
MEVGGKDLQNDHNNEMMVNSGECNGKNLDVISVDEPKSDLTIKFQDCQINCLQDIETLNKICQQMNLKFVKPNHLYHRHKRIKPQHPDEYEVEEIVDYVRDKYKEWYLIKWKGWESEFNTWEPYSNLTGCQELIENFHRSGRKANLQNHTNIG